MTLTRTVESFLNDTSDQYRWIAIFAPGRTRARFTIAHGHWREHLIGFGNVREVSVTEIEGKDSDRILYTFTFTDKDGEIGLTMDGKVVALDGEEVRAWQRA